MMKMFFPAVLSMACVSFGMSFVSQDPVKASIERGKKVYEQTCLPCHQANGSGVPDMNPPLSKTQYTLGSKDTLINIILNGFDQQIVIRGKTYGNPMPAQPQMKDEEIADVLTYVRNSFGNQASAVLPAEVKKMRPK